MKIDAIDSVLLAVADLDAACRPYEGLGLRLAPDRAGRALRVGGPANHFAVRFLGGVDAESTLALPRQQALAAGRSLFAVALAVADLGAAVRRLASLGVRPDTFREGEAELAWLPLHEQAGTHLVLCGPDSRAGAEPPGHTFPLQRLDHLAVVTHDLEEKTRFWAEVLGVAPAGEVTTPALVIRQLRLGDAVLELLGPAAADSPLWKRPPGLVGMASWQVADLDDAVARARGAGFTVTDPAGGVLPGTRVATVQGTELAGVNLQLLQYV